jgi:hypothetical protein
MGTFHFGKSTFMNSILLRSSIFITILLIFSSTATCQQRINARQSSPIRNTISRSYPRESGNPYGSPATRIISNNPLPESVILPPGTDSIPVASMWSEQSNSRALHNIQVDPSDPNKIHAVITGMTNVSGNDVGSLTRRVFYTYSSDAGKHWTKPVTLGKFRSGYADMVLYKRNGEWVPAIAAHVFLNADGSQITSSLWIEKGHEGEGNFAQCNGSVTSAGGSDENIIWPAIAVSSDGAHVYMIASVSPATVGGSEDDLQFGVWNLSSDTAIFQGWTATPGAGDNNNPTAGITSGGAYRIQVSQSGHIGVAWVNSQTADGSIYFSESTDKGVTWSSTIPTIAAGANLTDRVISDANNNQYEWTPTGSLDFWYDGDQPRFIYIGYYNNTKYYLPYTTTIYYVPDVNPADTIAIASADISGAQPGSIPNIIDMSGNDLDLQALPISWPTVARTVNPNQFVVFYQTYMAGDTEVFVDDTGTVIFPYGSIYYSSTLDGGKSWGDPTPFMTNAAGAPQKFDFRFPQASSFNVTGASGVVFHSMFSVDTAAGFVDSSKTPTAGNVPGFDVIGFAHATVTLAATGAVSPHGSEPSLAVSAFPNPFASSANIQFTLPTESTVLLTVSDMMGRTVATLANGRMGAGAHSMTFNGADFANGVYRYTLRVNGESVSRSMSLLR